MKGKKIIDLPPEEIRIALMRRKKRPSCMARRLGVTATAIYRVIDGVSISYRIRRAIAEATGIDIRQIWPSSYLGGKEPQRRPGNVSKKASVKLNH